MTVIQKRINPEGLSQTVWRSSSRQVPKSFNLAGETGWLASWLKVRFGFALLEAAQAARAVGGVVCFQVAWSVNTR